MKLITVVLAMLAVLGHFITTAGYRWPGALTVDVLKWEDIPSDLVASDVIPGKLFLSAC